MRLHSILTSIFVTVMLIVALHAALGDAAAQEPGAGCRDLDSPPPTLGRGPFHTAYPCSRFDVPAANSVLTDTAPVQVRGRSSANCLPTRQGAPTYVEKVELQLGAEANWQAIAFTSYDAGCLATWSADWRVPPLDQQLVVLRARTTAFHGLPNIYSLYIEDPPASLTVVVDTVPPRVRLHVPPFFVGDRLTIVWSAEDGAGIRSMEVQYDAGNGWAAWQVGPPGAAVFGPSNPAPVTPGRVVRFRARATDGNGLTSEWSAPQETRLVAGDARVYIPLAIRVGR